MPPRSGRSAKEKVMNKQEFLAMSLPYGLHCSFLYDNEDIVGSVICGMEFTVDGEFSSENPLAFIDEFGEYRFDIIKPILHPLSDLTKEIEHKGEKFYPIDKILENSCFNLSKMTRKEIDS